MKKRILAIVIFSSLLCFLQTLKETNIKFKLDSIEKTLYNIEDRVDDIYYNH